MEFEEFLKNKGESNQENSDISHENKKMNVQEFKDYVKKLNLANDDFFERMENEEKIQEEWKKLEDEEKAEIILDTSFIEKEMSKAISFFSVIDLIKELTSESLKAKIIDRIGMQDSEKAKVINTFSEKGKIEAILNSKVADKSSIIRILKTFGDESLALFFKEYREALAKNKVQPFEIIKELDGEQQKIFVERFLEETGLSLDDKKRILVFLSKDIKDTIETSKFSDEYMNALSLQTEANRIIIDLDRDSENYRGYDDLIKVNPEEYSEEQRNKFIKICLSCPNLSVESNYFLCKFTTGYISTGKEYIEGEKWIQSIISKLKPEYSTAQKIAIIDYEIGNRVSYSPDSGTEIFSEDDCRALWRIICSGYGICNGVANLEHYILKRAGIESEIISSGNHAFLKLNNIEVPLANGGTMVGNTILDPTWNLAVHRFGGKPENFFISYEEARKHDISKGKDYKCHKNDEELSDSTLNLDDKSLRMLFASVGLANQKGVFPIDNMLRESKALHEKYATSPEQDIQQQFELLSRVCPEFATCQNSSIRIIADDLLYDENLQFDRLVVKKVFDKQDKEKRPVMYVYIESEELGRRFYYADKDKGQMIELPEEEFIKRFECYDMDLEKSNGVRPWEESKEKEQEQEEVDLSRSSGMVAANKSLDSYSEGDER